MTESPAETYTVTLFDRAKDNRPKPRAFTPSELSELFGRHEIRKEKDGPLFSPTVYPAGKTRANAHVVALTLAVGDFDRGDISPEAVRDHLTHLGVAFWIYATHSSTPDCPKFRAVVLLSQPVPAVRWGEVWPALVRDLFLGAVDLGTRDAARVFYLPSAPPGSTPLAYQGDGVAFDWTKLRIDPEARRAPLTTPGDTSPITKGERRPKLMSIAGRLRNAGAGYDAVLAELRVVNETRCVEKLGDKDLEHVAASACRYEPGTRKKVLRRERPAPTRDLWIRKKKRDGTEEVLADRAAFEDRLLEERRFLSLRDSRELRVYSGERGFYVSEADTFVAQWVRVRFAEEGKTASTAFINEVVATMRDRSYRERVDVNPPWEVVVENGVLDVRTGRLRPHTPEPPFTFGLPVPYDPGAECPTFDRFLERGLPDKAARDAILEFSGYLLWPGNPLRKLLVLWGPTTTGKSTFAAILTGVFGTENIAAVDLSGLADNKFLAAEIADKIANVRSDIPWRMVRNVGLVQELTGGRDEISAERKYQHPFKFRPSAKLIFSCNRLPPVPGATPAYWTRILLLAWEVKVEEKDDQPDYTATLLKERTGIFRKFFNASLRLQERKRFAPVPVDIAGKWVRSSDPALWVAEHELEDDPKGEIALDEVVSRVDGVAEEENVEDPPSPRAVATAIRRAHPRVTSERRGQEKKTILRGVRAKVSTPKKSDDERGGEAPGAGKPPGDVPPTPSSDEKKGGMDTCPSQLPVNDVQPIAPAQAGAREQFSDPRAAVTPSSDGKNEWRHMSGPPKGHGPDPPDPTERDPEHDRQLAEGVAILRSQLAGNSAGYSEGSLRELLAARGFSEREIDGSLGRLYGQGGVVRSGDLVRLREAGA